MRNAKKMVLFIGAVLVLPEMALPQTQAVPATMIHVEIGGLRDDKGQVLCALYSSPDGFPKRSEKALAHASSGITDKKAVCEFPEIAPGTYAISVFHDQNSSGKLVDMTRARQAVTSFVAVRITDGQYGALCDFVYKRGGHQLSKVDPRNPVSSRNRWRSRGWDSWLTTRR